MPDCMRELDARGLRPAVLEAARSKPFLGICIGLQMLFERSEEGDVAGPGPAAGQGACASRARRWSSADGEQAEGAAHGLERGAAERWSIRCGRASPQGSRFYFVHSYYPVPARAAR